MKQNAADGPAAAEAVARAYRTALAERDVEEIERLDALAPLPPEEKAPRD